MYNVLLVDDEKLILEGLKNIIDWEELNLKISDTAENGEEALSKFKQNPADIVITDIMMPKMNGLNLIKEIKAIDNNIKFIILSGYDDFCYTKQAIKLNIENYILKPINEDELIETLKNTILKIESKMMPYYINKKNESIIKENILYRWVLNKIDSYELEERSFLFNTSLNNNFYSVLIIKLQTKLNINNIVKQLNKLSFELKYDIFIDFDEDIIVLYGNKNKLDLDNNLKKLSQEILKYLINLNINSFITIGNIEENFNDIHKSYKTAKKLQDYLIIKGYNNIISYDFYEKINNPKIQEIVDTKEYYKLILSKDKNKINEYIDNVFSKIISLNENTPENIQNTLIRMIFTLDVISREFNINYEENLKRLINEIYNLKTIDNLKEKITQESFNFIDNINSKFKNISPIIQQIVAYINENYKEELSLKTLGDKFNINPSYLGQIFKKEYGKLFTDYLNQVRNEKAKELLLNTNLKINEIAKMVGYEDASYFYRKFKDYFGLSPNSLRYTKKY